jgi:hypothetical protein
VGRGRQERRVSRVCKVSSSYRDVLLSLWPDCLALFRVHHYSMLLCIGSSGGMSR